MAKSLAERIETTLKQEEQLGYEACKKLHKGAWSIRKLRYYLNIMYQEIRSLEDLQYHDGFKRYIEENS